MSVRSRSRRLLSRFVAPLPGVHSAIDRARRFGRLPRRFRFLRRMERLEHFVWLLNRMPTEVPPQLDLSTALESPDDLLLVKRVMAAYRRAVAASASTEGFWDGLAGGLKKPIHEALIGDDFATATAILRDPASNVLFWGFDAVAR